MRLTLHDKLTLYLAETGDWVHGYALSKLQTKNGWVGSSGERRMRELYEQGSHKVDGKEYVIERRQVGKYVEYRIGGSRETRVMPEIREVNGRRVAVYG